MADGVGKDFGGRGITPLAFFKVGCGHDPMLEAVWGVGGVDSGVVAGGGDDGGRTERARHMRGCGVNGEDQSRGGDGF